MKKWSIPIGIILVLVVAWGVSAATQLFSTQCFVTVVEAKKSVSVYADSDLTIPFQPPLYFNEIAQAETASFDFYIKNTSKISIPLSANVTSIDFGNVYFSPVDFPITLTPNQVYKLTLNVYVSDNATLGQKNPFTVTFY